MHCRKVISCPTPGRERHEGKGVGEHEHDDGRKAIGDGPALLLRQMTSQGMAAARTTARLPHGQLGGRHQQVTLFAGGRVMGIGWVDVV